MSNSVLYTGTKNASSWAMRAWLALRAANYAFEERIVDIRRPARFRELVKIGEISPAACVPVLRTDKTVIFDSNAIMEFANDVSGGALLPPDPESRGRARSLIAWQHAGLSGICARISFESGFYPVRRPLSKQEQAECTPLLACYESCLENSGGSAFLVWRPLPGRPDACAYRVPPRQASGQYARLPLYRALDGAAVTTPSGEGMAGRGEGPSTDLVRRLLVARNQWKVCAWTLTAPPLPPSSRKRGSANR